MLTFEQGKLKIDEICDRYLSPLELYAEASSSNRDSESDYRGYESPNNDDDDRYDDYDQYDDYARYDDYDRYNDRYDSDD